MIDATPSGIAAYRRPRSTGCLAQASEAHPPPAIRGRRIRLDYITQPKSRPPTFVLFSSRAAALPETYRRYLINGLREAFALPGTPIRLTLRGKANPYAGRRARCTSAWIRPAL